MRCEEGCVNMLNPVSPSQQNTSQFSKKLVHQALPSEKNQNSLFTMRTGNPVEVLKRGLKVLETRINARRHDLMSKVAAKTKISDEDKEWPDKGGGNMVDEVHVIDELEKASNYERGLGRLDKKSKAVVQKLQELGQLAGDIIKVAAMAGNKRKRKIVGSMMPS